MFFFRKHAGQAPQKRPPVRAELAALVRQHLPDADDEDVRVATAVAGLCAVVAYADRVYEDSERARIAEDLARMPMFEAAAVEAVCALLDEKIVELATGNSQTHTRDLRDLLDVAGRREVLQVLVDLAAADGEIAIAEADALRRLTSALGLTQDDYLAAQDHHREWLSTLS